MSDETTAKQKRTKPDFTDCLIFRLWGLRPQDYGAPEGRHLTAQEQAVLHRALRRSLRIVDHGK